MPGPTRSNTSFIMPHKIEITVTNAGTDFHYHKGEIVECPAERARQLISDGYAIPFRRIERAISKDNVQNQDSSDNIPVKPRRSKATSKGKRKH